MFPLPETITIWNELTNDGTGVDTWDGPHVVPARIAHKQEKFTDVNGDDCTSSAVCYSESPLLKIDSKVFFGTSSATNPVDEADDARMISEIPSGTDLRKAWF